ncbi:VanZ like family protein [Gracilimonas mengyeensis]|uniref:VanZ like family protein n=2 Tax=Gracilimonas mengyeensis TaxID=1302730 RepID=A0A521B809_9BACT|nr:VanZ like family protein [Gracilimonas mengyeensis]
MFGAWSFLYGIVRFFRGHLKLYPVLIWGTIFGLSVEILQHFLPTNRSFELMDLAADLAGTFVAIGILYLLERQFPWFRNNQKK